MVRRMSWLRRLLLWLVLPLTVLVLVLPGFVGFGVRHYYPSVIAALDLQLPRHELISIQLEPGWFGSSATTEWRRLTDAQVLQSNSRLQHGPLQLGIGPPRVGWWSEQLTLSARGQPVLEAQYRVAWNGQLVGQWRGTVLEQPAQIIGEGQLQHHLSSGQTRASFELPQTSMFISEGLLNASVSGSLQIQDTNGSFDIAAQTVELDDVTIGRQLEFSVSTRAAAQTTEIALRADAQDLSWAGNSLTNLRLRANIKGLDWPSLVVLWQRWQTLQHVADPVQRAGQWNAELLLSLPQLFQHQPQLKLDRLDFLNDLGPISANGELHFPRGAPAALLVDPQRWLATLEGHFNARIPRQWLAQQLVGQFRRSQPWLSEHELVAEAEQWITQYEAQDWLRSSGEQLHADWQLAQGTLSLNGVARRLVPDD